jgi:hypothetical protein
MKYAICILAHDNPILLSKLIAKLQDDNTEIFVHLDAKCKRSDYEEISGATFIDKRVSVNWGGRSMITAMYNLIDYVVHNSECGYLIFISGHDYPIFHPSQYNKIINPKIDYVDYDKLPISKWYEGGLDRIRYYYFFDDIRSIYSKILIRLQKALKIKRNSLMKKNIYGGSQWINIKRETAKYILQHWDKYFKLFQYARIPDELIFQTILMNSDFKDEIINLNLRHLVFEEDASNPNFIKLEDMSTIKNKEVVTCRKIKDEIEFDRINEYMRK